MSFDTVMASAAFLGVAMIVIGALLLGLFPGYSGFGTRPLSIAAFTEDTTSPIKIVGKVLGVFLEIVKDVVTGKAGRFHIGQILIAIGFLLFLVSGILWLGAQAGSASDSAGQTTTRP